MPLLVEQLVDQLADGETATNGALGAGWEIGGAAPTARSVAAVHGARGLEFVGTGFARVEYVEPAHSDPRVLSFYIKVTVDGGALTYLAVVRDGSSTLGTIRLNAGRTVTIRNGTSAVATTNAVLQVGTVYRVDWRTTTTDQELRLYAGESTTPLETITGPLTAPARTGTGFGITASPSGHTIRYDTIRITDGDWPDAFAPPPPAVPVARLLTASGWVDLAAPRGLTPPPVSTEPWSGTKIIFAATPDGTDTGTDSEQATYDLEDEIATQLGETSPFFAGRHSYSGSNWPATFAQTSASNNATRGWGWTSLNVKCDWSQLADGAFDTHLDNFVASIPVGHVVYLVINHEPENDGDPDGPIAWATGQARMANRLAVLNDPRCYLSVCLMSSSWRTQSRDPQDWNPVTGGTIDMTQAGLDRAIFGPDGYTKMQSSDGSKFAGMDSRFGDPYDDAAAWGFSRFAVNEHALENDIGASDTVWRQVWETDHIPWLLGDAGVHPRARKLVYYGGYSSTGPAAGVNARINTHVRRQVIGNFTKAAKYGGLYVPA